MSNTFINPEVLPPFFRDAEIIGTANDQIPIYKDMYKHLRGVLGDQVDCPVTLGTSPTLLTTTQVQQIYQTSNFGAIKNLESQAQNDLQAVYSNIATYGKSAWTLVSSGGQQFYMTWSNTGSMWAYTERITSVAGTGNDGPSFEAVVQIGTYSSSTGVAGLHSYNLTLPTMVIAAGISLVVAIALSGIVAQGLGFAVAGFALLLTQAAAAVGFESFAFSISAVAISSVAFALVFAIVFIGLLFLWNWINRKYTIRLQILNWDSNNIWSCDNAYYGSNALIPGQDQNAVNFTLPKMIPAGTVITPPGFQPVVTLNAVCYYAIVIWQNNNTIFEGLSMALGIKNNTTSNGFMWALDCPRFSNNKQAAADGLTDPGSYLANANWNPNPQKFTIGSQNIPLTVTLDSLSGADDSLYNTIININYPTT